MGSPLFLINPGELMVSQAPVKLKTILGSCVAISVWSAEKQVGGLCHFLLAKPSIEKNNQVDFRYGCYAIPALFEKMRQQGASGAFQIGLFGGSEIKFRKTTRQIGESNVEYAVEWLKQHKLGIKEEDVGGNYSRNLLFHLNSGLIELRKISLDGLS